MTPHDKPRRGEFVKLKLERYETRAMIYLASENGRSLMVGFDALFAGYAGMMPLLWSDEGVTYVDIVESRAVQVTRETV